MGLDERKVAAAAALLARHPRPRAGAAWATQARAAAEERLAAAGAPGRRDEYWRFTDPATLVAPEVAVADDFRADARPVFDGIDRTSLVFVDGRFDAARSDPLVPEGIEIAHLADALADPRHWARGLFGVLEAAGQDPVPRPLAALNTAVADAGVAIRVTGSPDRPVALHYVHADPVSDAVIRHLVRIEPGAVFTLLETGPAAARFNKVMEVEVGDGAAFHHVRAQGRDHRRQAVTHVFARLGAASHYRSFTLTANGVLTRNEHVVDLTGPGASAHVAGACVGDGEDFHHDDTVFVTHGAEDCESRQVFKKVLKAGATGVFQGKILVRPGAQRTDGYQISQGLLLDEASRFLAKPELEIHADDVKCSHGSTCGAVDATQLFYLTSRGVPKAEAEALLVLAFLDQAMSEIADERLADDLRERLAGWLARRRGSAPVPVVSAVAPGVPEPATKPASEPARSGS
jgi:Fe-S cluster assembly protein SufD